MADRGNLTSVSDVKRMADMGEPRTATPTRLPELVRRQRVLVGFAGGLAVAAVAVGGWLGEWAAGLFVAVGIGLALSNALLTEVSIVRLAGGANQDLSRGKFALTALLRLSAVSVAAIVLVVAFWPVGGLVLVGLAVFTFTSTILTAFPLLRELRNS